MIIDKLKNAYLYYGLNERLTAGLKFIQETNFVNMEVGQYEIDGTNLFYQVQEYTTKPVEEGKWESHRSYMDIQFIVSGVEQMGYANIDQLEVSQEYDVNKDIMFWQGEGDYFEAAASTFVIFFPEDVHKPTLTLNTPQKMKKIVVKVKI